MLKIFENNCKSMFFSTSMLVKLKKQGNFRKHEFCRFITQSKLDVEYKCFLSLHIMSESAYILSWNKSIHFLD